ncbi:MAG: DUF177 domain-containing protein [Eubacteriales bacterium]
MLVNLTDVFTTADKISVYHYLIEQEIITIERQAFSVQMDNPIVITAKNLEKDKAIVEGLGRIVVRMNCDRCLEEVEHTLDISFCRRVNAPDFIQEEEEEEDTFLEGYSLNIENLVNNEILINWPTKVLCKETCRGICKSCGQDLNQGTCTCDTFVPDPRMAGIIDIFTANNKEV